MGFPKKLTSKLNDRIENNSLRDLKTVQNLIDFSSNDYLGFANSSTIFDATHQFLIDKNFKKNGASGSRLLTGNHLLYIEVEDFLSKFHQTESATIFNSGYDANLGFFSSIPQRGDVILYDEFIHASIRDGIQLSNAKSFKFEHNNCDDLERLLLKSKQKNAAIFVVTESVFSMDGDMPNLKKMNEICLKNTAYLVVDEAHALGVFGEKGVGIVQKLKLQDAVFARIITFGKGLGCHGAAILGSQKLKEYLVNFSRSLIYTTGLSPHSVATIKMSYQALLSNEKHQKKLQHNIEYFISLSKKLNLNFIKSTAAIQCCLISGNEKVKETSLKLQKKGVDVKAILSPTVSKNNERLRFCLHSFNTKKEIEDVLNLLCIFVK